MEIAIAIAMGVLSYHFGVDFLGWSDDFASAFGWLIGFVVIAGGPRFVRQVYKHWDAHIAQKQENIRYMKNFSKEVEKREKAERKVLKEKEAEVGMTEQEFDFFRDKK